MAVSFNTPMKLLMFLMVLVIMVLGIFVFLSSILYCYMLQKFYINGQPLLNNADGRTLYAAVVSMMICLAAACCCNNRSVHSLSFILFFAISAIVALSHIQKIKKHAFLYVLHTDGTLQKQNMTLGQMKLTGTFQAISISAIAIGAIVWLLGMMLAVSVDKLPQEVQSYMTGRSYF
jgi:hypothetical protein